MCGITGFYEDNNFYNEKLIIEMTNSLFSRGPDDVGYWLDHSLGICLGHRRLSIQDLTKNGAQPIFSYSKNNIIIYNGEIYNHINIRRALEIKHKINWIGNSDSETLINSIEIFGIKKTLELIDGMFAFAALDLKSKTLTLARDRFGEKPLYYGFVNKVFFFGSQVKSFKPHPKWLPEISLEALNEFLQKGYISSSQSIYKGIKRLPKGCYLKFDLIEKKIQGPICYWKHSRIENKIENKFDVIKQLDLKLFNSINARKLSDVPVGSFLSGGIDSSLITTYLHEMSDSKIDTFTIGFEDNSFDESKYARKISNFLGTNHHESIFKYVDFERLIMKIPKIWDEPFADPSQMPTLLLCEMTSNFTKVVLSGDGGDELFCGYERYNFGNKIYNIYKIFPKFLYPSFEKFNIIFNSRFILKNINYFLKSKRPKLLLDRLNKLSNVFNSAYDSDFYTALNSIFSLKSSVLKNYDFTEIKSCIERNEFEDYRNYMIARDLEEYLPNDILTKVDRASMEYGLEARAPFLDHELAEWAINIPIKYKRLDGKGKWPLRKLLSQKLPKELYERPKMGFGIPLRDLISGPFKGIVYEYLGSKKIKDQNIFNPNYIKNLLVSNYDLGKRFHNQIWVILMFQLWYYENF
tara:strand:+ start:1089 stop:2996 length:1908 start_codon:yes stop_codon:yes gene_type:complete